MVRARRLALEVQSPGGDVDAQQRGHQVGSHAVRHLHGCRRRPRRRRATRTGVVVVDHVGVDDVVDRGHRAGLGHRTGHVGDQEDLEDGQSDQHAEAERLGHEHRPRAMTVMMPIRPRVLMASGRFGLSCPWRPTLSTDTPTRRKLSVPRAEADAAADADQQVAEREGGHQGGHADHQGGGDGPAGHVGDAGEREVGEHGYATRRRGPRPPVTGTCVTGRPAMDHGHHHTQHQTDQQADRRASAATSSTNTAGTHRSGPGTPDRETRGDRKAVAPGASRTGLGRGRGSRSGRPHRAGDRLVHGRAGPRQWDVGVRCVTSGFRVHAADEEVVRAAGVSGRRSTARPVRADPSRGAEGLQFTWRIIAPFLTAAAKRRKHAVHRSRKRGTPARMPAGPRQSTVRPGSPPLPPARPPDPRHGRDGRPGRRTAGWPRPATPARRDPHAGGSRGGTACRG